MKAKAILDDKKKDDKKKPAKKGKKKKAANSSSEDSESDEEVAPSGKKKPPEVDWKDPQLSVELLALITQDKKIKQALYPPCGPNASTSNGGGEHKVQAQWNLCVKLLGSLPKYADAIAAVDSAKDRTGFANKIKNRLSTMAKTTRSHNNEMGQLAQASNVPQKLIPALQTLSRPSGVPEINDSCPWFFEMRDLIGECPSLVPVGLGHSNTDIDNNVLMPLAGAIVPQAPASSTDGDDGGAAEADDGDVDNDDEEVPIPGWDHSPGRPSELRRLFPELSRSLGVALFDDDTGGVQGAEDGADEGGKDQKGKGKTKEKKTHTIAKKNPAKPTASTPAAPAATAPKPSKKTKLVEVSEIAKSEEVTQQKEIELAGLRTSQAVKAMEVRGQLGEKREERLLDTQKSRSEERQMKLRMKELKMKQRHELKMTAAAKAGPSHAASLFSFFDGPSSHYSSSEPDYSQCNFAENTIMASGTSSSSADYGDGSYTQSLDSANNFPSA
ncbi:hypothetical protein C8J57DRAFT_1727348 [Mycena rebaudengoi]|nr:hypothetical protein C8J57DRAFT_1727348 [Mycena rebaudengoi]